MKDAWASGVGGAAKSMIHFKSKTAISPHNSLWLQYFTRFFKALNRTVVRIDVDLKCQLLYIVRSTEGIPEIYNDMRGL